MTSSVAISVPLCLCGYLWSFNFFAKEPKIVYFTAEDAEDSEIQSCFLLSAQLSFPYFSANSANSAVENCSSSLCLCVSVALSLPTGQAGPFVKGESNPNESSEVSEKQESQTVACL